MRTLSQEEKQFVKTIIDKYHNTDYLFIQNIMDFVLKGISLTVNRVNKTATYKIDKEIYIVDKDGFESGDIINRKFDIEMVHSINRKIATLSDLVLYLHNLGFLFLFQEAEDRDMMSFGDLSENADIITKDLYDNNIIEGLIRILDKSIIVREPLIEYYNNGFKTPEEKRFERNYKSTKAALIVSITLGLLSIAISS